MRCYTLDFIGGSFKHLTKKELNQKKKQLIDAGLWIFGTKVEKTKQ